MFVRKKKESFLTLNDRALKELQQVSPNTFRSKASTLTFPDTSTGIKPASATTPLIAFGIFKKVP